MKIAIIGAGLTGLVAAYELAKEGHEVSVFEKNNTIGGLASGFEMHGESLEKTYHHIFKTDTDIINLVEELGLSTNLKWYDSSVCIYFDKKIYPFGGALDLLKFCPISFVSRIRQGLVILFLQKYKNWQNFTKISAYEWMKKYSGNEALKVIWEPLLKGKFEKYFDKVSMAWLWARLHVRANSRKFGEGEKLGYFDGGFRIIFDELEKKLKENNVNIVLNANISEIFRDDKNDSVQIKLDNNVQKFDKIICTIPSSVFANFIKNNREISPQYIERLNSINYLGAICLVFSSAQNLSQYYWHNINDLHAPFLAFIHHTALIKKEKYGGNFVYYIGTYLPHENPEFTMNDEELSGKWFDYLKNIFSDFDKSKVISKSIFKLKNAQHIVDLDYESKIPKHETPLKNVFLANFSQIFPEDRGTNFAVREGKKIAKLVVKSD